MTEFQVDSEKNILFVSFKHLCPSTDACDNEGMEDISTITFLINLENCQLCKFFILNTLDLKKSWYSFIFSMHNSELPQYNGIDSLRAGRNLNGDL